MSALWGDVVESLRTARARGVRPEAPGANLWGADLRRADLSGADLRGADLWDADLRRADLRRADLRRANLWRANLWGADLWGADLRRANLWGADLRDADLRDADLRGANLWGAGVVALGATPSGNALIYPTPDGWAMCVGCWKGSPDELRSLIDQEHGWPEAGTTAERARRRPYLALVLAHADLVMAEHPDLVPALAEKWGAS